MENKYFESAYNPYPWQMKGTYYEFKDNDETRFIEVHNLPIDGENAIKSGKKALLERGFVLSMYVKIVGFKNIKEDTYFLYKLVTYIGNTSIKALWEFRENVSKYEVIGFTSINQLNDYCMNRWGFNIEVFVPHSKTSLHHLID